MFHHLTLRGTSASLLWGYHTAAALTTWTIAKTAGGWTLKATIRRADAFQLRQTPLLFTAPRKDGWWAWGINSIDVGPTFLVAKLGPPEQ